MPIIPLTCPNCGANLQVNSDDPILTCQYCGSSSVMKDAIVQSYIQHTVNITAGTVNVVNQKDFVIEGGILKKYQGESVDVVIPNNVVSIEGAFENLKIRSVVIPDSVTEIGDEAFRGCTSLTSITIPGSVTAIGDWAFYGCTSLASVTILGSLKKIGCGAFQSTPYEGSRKHRIQYQEERRKRRIQNEEERRIRADRQRNNLCQYCGGDFKGIFTKVCERCGKPKDY